MSEAVLVIGATRGTGKAIVEQLIKRGQSCTVLARDVPKAKSLFGTAIDVVYGDVTRPDTLSSTITNAFTAIIYTVDITGGVGGRGFFASHQQVREVVYRGVVNTVDAAKARDFSNQFILLTTMGLDKPATIMALLNIIKPGVVRASKDKATYLIQSGLPFTIVQAGALHDGPDSKQPLVIKQGEIPMRMSCQIGRQHLAQVMVACIGNPSTYRKIFNVYGGQGGKLDKKSIAVRLSQLT